MKKLLTLILLISAGFSAQALIRRRGGAAIVATGVRRPVRRAARRDIRDEGIFNGESSDGTNDQSFAPQQTDSEWMPYRR